MKSFDVAAFAVARKAEIEAIQVALEADFDTPAQRHINGGFRAMGVQRFVGGHDRWEQVRAYLDGTRYKKPPAHLIGRWSAY